jgi:hypothetical protein
MTNNNHQTRRLVLPADKWDELLAELRIHRSTLRGMNRLLNTTDEERRRLSERIVVVDEAIYQLAQVPS